MISSAVDPHFSNFANSLRGLMIKHEQYLHNDLDQTPEEHDQFLLSVQKEQVVTLLQLEREFRLLLISSGIAEEVYSAFIRFIRDDKRNILVARPFFRERQGVFTARVSPALEKRDPAALVGFNFNANFIQFAIKSRRWTEQSENLLKKKFHWWSPIPATAAASTPLAGEERMIELVVLIFALRTLMVECNLPLVVDWAKRFAQKTQESHLSRMDMVSIAAEGWLAAIDKLEISVESENGPVPWQGTDNPNFSKEPGSVLRSVGIGRMTGNLIDSYSGTLIHFWPSDRRKLYRANKHRGSVDARMDWYGIESLDFEQLAAAVNVDDKNGGLVEEMNQTDPVEIADIVAASSCVSPSVDEHGNDLMSQFPDNNRPDVEYEDREVWSKILLEIPNLSLIERKLLSLKGISDDLC